MGKKILRKGYGKSKGLHGSGFERSVVVSANKFKDPFKVLSTIHKAWKEAKNPWITIQNPMKTETNRLFIKVRANDYWGRPGHQS